MEADQKQVSPRKKPWEAFRARLRRKPPPHPSIAAVMAQWAEYELIFNDILQRLNAQLARQAKMEKKALERLTLEGGGEDNGAGSGVAPPILQTSKQALRSAWAAQRYGGLVTSLVESKEARE
jgi:hypothetical protein